MDLKNGITVWPNESQPTDYEGWKVALLDNIEFALAAFLTVAGNNTYFTYGLWYEIHQGWVTEDPPTCAAPDSWYPILTENLGPPLGPKRKGRRLRLALRLCACKRVLGPRERKRRGHHFPQQCLICSSALEAWPFELSCMSWLSR